MKNSNCSCRNFIFSILFVPVLLLASPVFSQSEPSSVVYSRIGIYEVSLGYQHRLNSAIGIGLEADYRPAFKESSYNNMQWGSWSASQTGFRFRPLVSFYSEDWVYFTLAPSFRYLTAGELIYDPGKFGGSNTSDYAVYSQITQEYGVNFFYNRPLSNNPWFEYYFGAGVSLKNIECHYSIQGSFTNQQPSNEIRRSRYILPSIYVGIKLNIFSFGEIGD